MGDALNLVGVAARGFQHNGRPHGVDAHPQHRVGAHKGDLQRGQVDDVGDAVVRHGAFKEVEVGNVTRKQGDIG